MRISQRLKDIEYQVLKNLWFEPTDEQRVRMVKRIMYSALRQAATRGEDLSAFAVDPGRPIELLGVSLTFDTETDPPRSGRLFSLSRGAISLLNEDIDTPKTSLGNLPIPGQTPGGDDDPIVVPCDDADLIFGLIPGVAPLDDLINTSEDHPIIPVDLEKITNGNDQDFGAYTFTRTTTESTVTGFRGFQFNTSNFQGVPLRIAYTYEIVFSGNVHADTMNLAFLERNVDWSGVIMHRQHITPTNISKSTDELIITPSRDRLLISAGLSDGNQGSALWSGEVRLYNLTISRICDTGDGRM